MSHPVVERLGKYMELSLVSMGGTSQSCISPKISYQKVLRLTHLDFISISSLYYNL